MKTVIDLPDSLLRKVQELFSKKQDFDINSFIISAIDNQLRLENRDAADLKHHMITGKIRKDEPIRKVVEKDAFSSRSEYLKIKAVEAASDKSLFPDTDVISRSGQLWGQINRIFPVKLTLRYLAKTIVDSNGSVSIDDFRNNCSSILRDFGLKWKNQHPRDYDKNTFLIGLPLGDDEEKSLTRFKNHFIGLRKADGTLDGALAKLKFTNISPEGVINFTKQGLEFMMLKNPILDGGPIASGAPVFSKEEILFFVNHIKESVRGEYDAFRWLLQTIDSGTNSRRDMERELKIRHAGWSLPVVTTQHMGLVSRCSELLLLKKERQGKEVKYILTKEGKDVARFERAAKGKK